MATMRPELTAMSAWCLPSWLTTVPFLKIVSYCAMSDVRLPFRRV